MNFNLFLIILIALIIIFCIILYNGIRILLTVGKEKGTVKYEFKVTVLKIPIFKRTGSEGIIDIIRRNNQEDDSEKTKEDSESKDEISKTQKESSEPKNKSSKTQKESAKSKDETRDKKITDSEEEIAESEEVKEEEEEKSLREKYKEIKPILKELKKAKKELKTFLKNILKAINLKKLEGHLIIGLSDHATTIKIASWIWSIGAIVNSKKPTLLTVEPRFTEIIVDFEGKIELKINLLLLLIYSLLLLTQKNIRELIKVIYREYRSQSKEEDEEEEEKEPVEEENKEKTNKVKEETSENKENTLEKDIGEETKEKER